MFVCVQLKVTKIYDVLLNFYQTLESLQDRLSAKELRRTLELLLEVALCPVCHETLTPAVVQCVRGHPVCAACHRGLPTLECPLCRDNFSNVQPSMFIQQVVEALPHPCRHAGCEYFVKTKDKHEKFCVFKTTECHYCEWSGPAKELTPHIHSAHAGWAQRFLSPAVVSENGMPLNPHETDSVFTPIFVDGHFFWGEMKNEPEVDKLTAIFHAVPCGESTSVFKGCVKLSSKAGSFKADVKLNMDPEANAYVENCITIPTPFLQKFTVRDKFEYKITVVKIKLESMYNFVQSKLELFKK